MKNILLSKVTMCIIALFTLTLSASAQNTNATDEYKETLKKIMNFSGTSTTTDDFLQRLSSIMKLNAPKKNEAYWNEFSKNWKEKVENKVFEMYMPVYEKHLTLEELKAVAAFYESPVGKKYKEASLMVMRETTPLLVQQLHTEMSKEVMPEKSERVKRGEQRLKEYEQKQKRDKELYAQAYMLPSDSIVIVPEEVYEKAYRNGWSTTPSLYSIERRKNDTKVTFIQPIYWDWQWLYYSPGFKIVDKKSGDEYNVRGYDGGAPMGRLVAVKGFNHKYIYISLLFPKLKNSVKEIDILELPHEKDKEQLPSNDNGKFKSYFNIKVKDYQVVSEKKNKKIYY
ncbi:DUF2059 domain-containing protein [Bacteroides caecimuris]|uniref:DUF2059 domain-containing protein n=1 Tax=Bacteroides caecimuris TaxID=1796613 RepID=UPI00263A6991|nr:DUF2059 domain-containing protein [Bacteroides caecimuris]